MDDHKAKPYKYHGEAILSRVSSSSLVERPNRSIVILNHKVILISAHIRRMNQLTRLSILGRKAHMG